MCGEQETSLSTTTEEKRAAPIFQNIRPVGSKGESMAEIRFEQVIEEWEEDTPEENPYFCDRLMVMVMVIVFGISVVVAALFGNR